MDDQLKLATEMTEELAKAQVELHQARNDCAAQSQHCKDLRRGLSESEHKVNELTAQAATLREELTRQRMAARAGETPLTRRPAPREDVLAPRFREGQGWLPARPARGGGWSHGPKRDGSLHVL